MPLESYLPVMAPPRAERRVPIPTDAKDGSWRYLCPRRSRRHVATAVLLSAGVHIGVIFGLGHRPRAVPVKPAEAEPITVAMVMPKLEDLEPPAPDPDEKTEPVMDANVMLPSQPDLPHLVLATDFVQQLDMSSLVPRDLNQTNLLVIPEHVIRGNRGDGSQGIFNLAELDRQPEAMVQPPPVFPQELKASIPDAKVIVGFVIDAHGFVVSAHVIESTHPGFENAALQGVARWRFRPGMKGGRKVGARMEVPIIFRVVED